MQFVFHIMPIFFFFFSLFFSIIRNSRYDTMNKKILKRKRKKNATIKNLDEISTTVYFIAVFRKNFLSIEYYLSNPIFTNPLVNFNK